MNTELERSMSTLQRDGIKLTRLPDIIEAVWERLPPFDREYIAQNAYFTLHGKQHMLIPVHSAGATIWINDSARNDPHEVRNRTLFRSDLFFTSLVIPDIASNYYRISFKEDIDGDDQMSDLNLSCTVAHELAHAVLRHSQLTNYILHHCERSVINSNSYNWYHELCAEAQVRMWGFDAEADENDEFRRRAAAAAQSN